MTVKEFLSSPLLPRCETSPDMWSHESYWGLTNTLSLYSHGFNNTTYDKQSKPIIQNLQDMTPEKYKLLEQFENYEIKQVVVFSYSGEHNYCVATHIQIEITDEELRKMGLLK